MPLQSCHDATLSHLWRDPISSPLMQIDVALPVATIGEGIDLVLNAIEDLLGGVRGLEELEVDLEGAGLDGRLEVAPRPRGVLRVECRQSIQGRHQIRRVRPTLQHLLQLPR
jgi:hypothetical protein